MSKTIQHKRSSIAGNKPDDTQIAVGELAINFPDRILYTKDGDGEVFPLIGEIETKPLEGGTILSEPTNTHPAGPVTWKGAGDRILTAIYPLVISDDGYNFTDKIETTDNNTEIWTKWAGEPGSNNGIDGPHGTTIAGTVSDGLGGSQSFELTIDKETSFVFHNFVDSDQTVGGVSESRVVTVHSVNSYVYPYGSTTGASPEYAKNSGDWNAMPATNSGSATDYMTAGDEFQLRHQDAATNNTASTYNFIMAGDSADWTTVTADVDPVILQPTIESPATDGELSISPNGPFVSSEFEMAQGTDTHTASSWEIMGVGTGVQSVVQSLDSDTSALTSWEPTGLEGNKDYTVKVKHHTATLNSEWSEERSFRTAHLPGEEWTYQRGLESAVGAAFMYSVAWSGTQFCAVGEGGECATSPDGVTWTRPPSGTNLISAVGNNLMNSVAWDGSQFCAVGSQGQCATSPDGSTWTNQLSFAIATDNYPMWAVTWTGTQFCAVGEDGKCATSPDGVTWTNQPGLRSVLTSTSVGYYAMYAIAWDGSQFCAVGKNGTCVTSPDGVTWTNQPSFDPAVSSAYMHSVTWDGNQFCAVGTGGKCATSPDGVTWTNQQSFYIASGAGSNDMYSIAWTGTQFCAVGGRKLGLCVTSPDGVTWTNQQSLESRMHSVTWTGTQFCAVGTSGACSTSP